ncbi:MAG: SDR family NAD(P)-dependent oxidoreductase [Verrucomicrobiaceae bacterium]
MNPHSLQNHVALVTGSSKGLGAGIAQSLANAGAKVVINAFNNIGQGQKIADEIIANGGSAIAIKADVSRESDVKALIEQAGNELGPVDIIVPNATPPQPQKPIEEYDEAFYRQMLDFFVISPFLLAQAALPAMKAQKWGRFINITSEVFACSNPNFSAYVAAKGGQIGWSRSMAKELAPHGITVNMIAPGWIPVERHANDPQEDKDGYFSQIPAGRWGTPSDIGNAVTFFASEASSFITGQTLHVNGGMTPW